MKDYRTYRRRKNTGVDDNKKTILIGVGVVIVIFVAYFAITSSQDVFVVSFVDERTEEVISEETIGITRSLDFMQSILGGGLEYDLILQSTKPVTESKHIARFRVYIENPFNAPATFLRILEYKNDELVGGVEFEDFEVGEEFFYTYHSQKIDLTGLDAQRNNYVLIASFERNNQIVNYTYEYQYLSLTECTTNDDCPLQNPVCDVNNVARFSDNPFDTYCTRPCSAHGECYEGQICIGGFCGY